MFWYTANELPVAYGGAGGFWSVSSGRNRRVSWEDVEPAIVQVDGDLAFIYYSVTWTAEANTGVVQRNRSRRLSVFRRQNGRWLMAGGSVAGVP